MTDPSHIPDQDKGRISQALQELSQYWAWFIAGGVLLVFLGIVALVHVFAATLVSVLFIGALMVAGGIIQLAQAWRMKHWKGFLVWTLAGVLYAAAGTLAIVNPVAGASVLTLLFGAVLIGSGAFRLWVWFNNRSQRGWQWIAFSGVITLATGLLIAIDWPGNSVWILGLLLSLDLFMQGWTLLLAGLALRSRR